VHAGQAVTLVSANRPDVPPVASTVRASGGTIDATMGTAEVRVGLPAGAPLYFGEHVEAAIVIEQAEGLVAPRSAVLPDEGKQVLFTVKDGKAVRHEVKLGIIAGDLVQVVSDNLRAGDSVVTLGNYELTDGMAIQAEEKGAGSTSPAPEAKP
jgi:multidrug efflux pump subunit AcrA (membrane-fusion protein)